jgi:lipopolysaccharide transport system ATP-binding protein
VVDSGSLVSVEHLGKRYCKKLKASYLFGIEDIAREVIGLPRRTRLRRSEFWGFRDVNFELRRGECLGLIGHNGAGKSSVLKVLGGILTPDEGVVTVRGRIAALIELGAGFAPVLTGRENIWVNAALHGLSPDEISRKFDEIVEFAELDEFIDSPLKTYSSGMKVRLGFAVASQVAPDVLLIDEVLAVGDIRFRTKCLNRIYEIKDRAGIVFVSHSMAHVANICDRVCLMEKGRARVFDDVEEGIAEYYRKAPLELMDVSMENGCRIRAVEIVGNSGEREISNRESCRLDIELEFDEPRAEYEVMVQFLNSNLDTSLVSSSAFDGRSFSSNATGTVSLLVDQLPLAPGQYTLAVTVTDVISNSILGRRRGIQGPLVTGIARGGAHYPRLFGHWTGPENERLHEPRIVD